MRYTSVTWASLSAGFMIPRHFVQIPMCSLSHKRSLWDCSTYVESFVSLALNECLYSFINIFNDTCLVRFFEIEFAGGTGPIQHRFIPTCRLNTSAGFDNNACRNILI